MIMMMMMKLINGDDDGGDDEIGADTLTAKPLHKGRELLK